MKISRSKKEQVEIKKKWSSEEATVGTMKAEIMNRAITIPIELRALAFIRTSRTVKPTTRLCVPLLTQEHIHYESQVMILGKDQTISKP